MAIGKVIHKYGSFFPDFDEIFYKIKYEIYRGDWETLLFLQIPNLKKTDILEYFEDHFLGSTLQDGCEFNDTCFPLFFTEDESLKNSIKPNYNSEYVSIIGQLFLAGYIDFGINPRSEDKYTRTDYPTNLSYYKEDKYQAWIYFRDNFFYTNTFLKSDEDDILIYKGKEYTANTLPKLKKGETIYSTMYGAASWDMPRYWSGYNIWVARTEKGTKYLREILEPRIYNKYKDLEVEIDDKGNIIRWIGKINR
ncbi:hypothetical protein [Campylobacter coli]|uniref:hypothetical protein n=1 Tax=Campylobacter coli TaxID=195 RepID=UPI00092E6731|nr:hypothetical protein [Campylobacter coli]HEB7545995.1 hypothetical protein [Campylobacter coli]HEB7552938.1 hypothetical protein [Campylobacter coli]HED6595326.1 hypothetical protein [Campylobacter coli]HED6603932.1 hypothetical protein [Campylobacter coli]